MPSLPPMKPKSMMPPKPPAPKANGPSTVVPAKSFSIRPWAAEDQGEKIIIAGPSGSGKSTLAAMAPNPVFLAPDDGARRIRNAKTGEPISMIEGIESFEDARAAVQNRSLLEPFDTLVVDTITKLEQWAEQYMFAHYKHEKGHMVSSIEGYGFGKGWRHLQEVMRLFLQDLDGVVRAGKNVVLLAQENSVKVANAEGLDWLQMGPKLSHAGDNGKYSVRDDYKEWADHIGRICYSDTNVIPKDATAKVGKLAANASQERIIQFAEARHFVAKTRPLKNGGKLPAVISFESEADDALWQWMFQKEQA